MKKRILITIIIALLFNTALLAVETAPRITDREIIESLAELKAGQEALNKRFDSMENRFNTLLIVMVTFFIAILGYIMWDRRTMIKPLSERILNIEREMGIGETDKSKLTRLIEDLRELSRTDKRVEMVLRQFQLL